MSIERGEVLAAPRTGPAVPGADELGAVVAGKDDDRIVTDASPVHGIEHLTEDQIETIRRQIEADCGTEDGSPFHGIERLLGRR